MKSKPTTNPLDAIRQFFSKLEDEDSEWLVPFVCLHISDELKPSKINRQNGLAWIFSERIFPRNFGVLISTVAVLDFILSDSAKARMAADADHLAKIEYTGDINHGVVANKQVARLPALISAWKDLRVHELDEASLWVYRDEMQHKQRTRRIGG